jgi:hypothetical protein
MSPWGLCGKRQHKKEIAEAGREDQRTTPAKDEAQARIGPAAVEEGRMERLGWRRRRRKA